MTKIKLFIIALTVALFANYSAIAQTDGAVFNPYSQYGLGDLSTLGTAATKGMGGAGIAKRQRFTMNLLNPASYNSTDRQNVLFSASGSGTNNYLKSDETSNSRNYFSLGHIGMQLRLSKRFGYGLVIAPYSDMGYEISKTLEQNDVITNIGSQRTDFLGSGGIAQFKTGIAGEVFKNFNLGVNYVYYVGSFTQNSATVTSPYVTDQIFKTIFASYVSEVSLSSVEIGAQYTVRFGEELRWLHFGLTYQPKTFSKAYKSEIIANGYNTSSLGESGIIKDIQYEEGFYIPTRIGFGVNYATDKLTLAADYTFEGWADAFPNNTLPDGSYRNRNTLRLGAQYIPNRFDIRSFANRMSYRIGMVLGNSYIVKDDVKTNDIAATLGLGIPIEKDWFSEVNIAAEFGTNGTQSSGLIRNNYIKLNVGITFAARRWFVRFKYH